MKPSRRTYKNVVESREFTLSLPTESQIDAVDFVGTRKLRNVPDKIDRSGLELRSMTEVDSPAVVGCPIVMACRLLDILDRHSLPTLSGGTMSHHVVLGQLVECRVDTTWIRDNEVRIEEVPSLIYLNRYYAALGERLAVQRFTDDDSVRDAKMEAYRRI